MKQEACNKELILDVANITGERVLLVKDIIQDYTKFISDMIKEGAFETMIIPYFGKFEPKTKQIQRRFNQRGKLKKHYERDRGTVRDDSGLQSGTEQTVVSTNPGV